MQLTLTDDEARFLIDALRLASSRWAQLSADMARNSPEAAAMVAYDALTAIQLAARIRIQREGGN